MPGKSKIAATKIQVVFNDTCVQAVHAFAPSMVAANTTHVVTIAAGIR
jgi:hypothetical protein